jgi:hypothetical protein
MTLEPIQYALGAGAGGLVGFSLGLIGGGGSILAVPLLVYLVGVPSPHVAIGTSAFAVAANAATGLINHARAGHVKWRCGAIYAAIGIVGAAIGSTVGKHFDGQKLLFLFALLMIAVAVMMLVKRHTQGKPGAECSMENLPKMTAYGMGTGIFSGFFGIGGGFLIVPGLIAATQMPILNAIGTSLVAVTAFGLTTAFNYSLSGLVDWPLAFIFIAGGFAGTFLGTHAARHLSKKSGWLHTVFAVIIIVVAIYVLARSIPLLMQA